MWHRLSQNKAQERSRTHRTLQISESILKYWETNEGFYVGGGMIRNTFRKEQGWLIVKEQSIWTDQLDQGVLARTDVMMVMILKI